MISNITGVLKTYEVFKTEEQDRHLVQKTGKPEEYKDTVAISERAKDYQSVRIALQNVPDVREGLVSAVKKKYESGGITASASEIAEKLIAKA